MQPERLQLSNLFYQKALKYYHAYASVANAGVYDGQRNNMLPFKNSHSIYKMLVKLFIAAWLLACLYTVGVVFLTRFNYSKSTEKSKEDARIKEQQLIATFARIAEIPTPLLHSKELDLIPVIITFDNGHIYALHFTPPGSDWKPLSVEDHLVFFCEKDCWNLMQQQNQLNYPIGDQLVYVFRAEYSHQNYIAFLQGHLFLLLAKQFNYTPTQFPTQDQLKAENITFMQMEERLLSDFLHSFFDPTMPKALVKEYVHNFVALNMDRRSGIDAETAQREDLEQTVHGLAFYYSLKLLAEKGNLEGFNPLSYLLEELNRTVTDEDILEQALHKRHHNVGAVIAYILDYLEIPDWHEQIQQQNIPPGRLLINLIPLTPEELVARRERSKRKYGYVELSEHVATSLIDYQQEIGEIVEEYQKMQGAEIILAKPHDQKLLTSEHSSTFIYYLDNGTIMTLSETSTDYTADKKWQVRFDGAPILFRTQDSIRFKADPNMVVNLDGRFFFIHDLLPHDRVIPFHNLSLEGATCTIECTQLPGELRVDNQAISIKFFSL